MARLRPVPKTVWSAVEIPGITHWLWADTSGTGLHLEPDLGRPPAEVTHVWGWDDAGLLLARLRVDRDLSAGDEPGVVGAVLDLSGGGEGKQVDVEPWDSQVGTPTTAGSTPTSDTRSSPASGSPASTPSTSTPAAPRHRSRSSICRA